MTDTNVCLSYSLAVFTIVFISGCAVNLLKRHFIFQLTGIAFFFTCAIFKVFGLLASKPEVTTKELYFTSFPLMAGISSCLISMVLGFWAFPVIRKKIKG